MSDDVKALAEALEVLDGEDCVRHTATVLKWIRRAAIALREQQEYVSSREQGLQDAWNAVNALIRTGPMEHDQHERRNGLVLASNAIMALRAPATTSISGGES